MPSWSTLLAWAAVLAPAGALAGQAPAAGHPAAPASPTVALVGATLVDGTGVPPVRDAVVLLRGGRISCAGPRASCPIPAGSERVNIAGKWIIPGLVDAHVHYSQTGWVDGRPDAGGIPGRFPYDSVAAALEAHPDIFWRSYLCSGVTATFDVGGFPWTWGMRRQTEGSTNAPHVAVAGPLLSTIDHWVNTPAERQFIYLADSAAVVRGARYLAYNGTDAMKVWFIVQPNADTARLARLVRAAAEEAKRAGKPLLVHATGLWEAKEALRDGAAILVHSVDDKPVDDDFIALARAHHTIYVPTLTVERGYEQVYDRHLDTAGRELECVDPATRAKIALTDSVVPTRKLTAEQWAARKASMEASMRMMAANLKRVHDAGIPIAMGTDAGNPLTLHGPAVFPEMEAMQAAGLTPMEVLVASTRNGARAMGRERDLGTIERGKIADLVVLAADPTADIRNVRRIELVVRGGAVRRRAQLEFGREVAAPAR